MKRTCLRIHLSPYVFGQYWKHIYNCIFTLQNVSPRFKNSANLVTELTRKSSSATFTEKNIAEIRSLNTLRASLESHHFALADQKEKKGLREGGWFYGERISKEGSFRGLRIMRWLWPADETRAELRLGWGTNLHSGPIMEYVKERMTRFNCCFHC